MSDKEYKPDFMTQMGRSGLMGGLGDIEALRALGVDVDSPIKKACQRRLKRMYNEQTNR